MSERRWYLERGFVLSAVFLGLLAVVAVAMFVGGHGDSTRQASARTGVPDTSGHRVNTGGSMCGLPVGNTDKPVGPPDATWTLEGQFAVPSSPTAGPGIRQGHRRVCFAHSPTGALFAAANFVALAHEYGGDIPLMREILAKTKARDILLKQNAEPSDPFARVEIAGFRVSIVTRDLVVVDLAFRSNAGTGEVAMTLPERWEQRPAGGDWRTMITDIEQPYQVAPVSDTSDFVFWAGT